MPSETPLRVLGVSERAELRALMRETIATALPRLAVDVAEPAELGAARAPEADCLVLDAGEDGLLDAVRRLRAGGFPGAIVLLVEERDDLMAQRLAPLGALEVVPRREMTQLLPPAVVAALGGTSRSSGGALEALRTELRRTQRLIAAGEIALELQHAVNNPLTALLAEAQLLEMESLTEEQQSSVKRIVELCRRVISIVRRLDAVGGKK